jgi:hypothetical protein
VWLGFRAPAAPRPTIRVCTFWCAEIVAPTPASANCSAKKVPLTLGSLPAVRNATLPPVCSARKFVLAMNGIGFSLNRRMAASTFSRQTSASRVDHERAFVANLHHDVALITEEHVHVFAEGPHVNFAVVRFRVDRPAGDLPSGRTQERPAIGVRQPGDAACEFRIRGFGSAQVGSGRHVVLITEFLHERVSAEAVVRHAVRLPAEDLLAVVAIEEPVPMIGRLTKKSVVRSS